MRKKDFWSTKRFSRRITAAHVLYGNRNQRQTDDRNQRSGNDRREQALDF